MSPKASRLKLPGEYGVAPAGTLLLPWSHVIGRMTAARHYWICTVDPAGMPHATPVDGIWLDDRLYFGGSARTRRQRNIAANPNVCVHLEDGLDVVILHGEARLGRPPRPLAASLAKASKEKYGYGPTADQYVKSDVTTFTPRIAFAWTHLPKDATRWDIERADAVPTEN